MSMFCFQCQETAKGTGCTVRGVCGKSETLAQYQDVLIDLLKGIAVYAEPLRKTGWRDLEIDHFVIKSLFSTITNANFDSNFFIQEIMTGFRYRHNLHILTQSKNIIISYLPDSATWKMIDSADILKRALVVDVLATEDENIRSLQQVITYGLKGIAAYYYHALELDFYDDEIMNFVYLALVKLTQPELSTAELLDLVMACGKYGVQVMALLDKANTSTYGNPEITEVNIGVKNRPGILISGHDLRDIFDLLEQTQDTGVDVYTHSEMLPAHYYPAFKKYAHFAGNYGNAWWKQGEEFEAFNGPILMTSNCIIPIRDSYKDRIYTTGAAGYECIAHIPDRKPGQAKDFSTLIAQAKTCPPPTPIETGKIVGGFAHHTVLGLAQTVIEAIQKGQIKQFVVMAGCDGRMKSREYYTEFAKALPPDTIILTAGCAKYRYNKLNLGDIGGIPRVLDAGQCNDSYSLVKVALALKDVLGLKDINDLPIFYNIAWYEQKAVIVLLALLYLGVKNIHLGPTLPGFLSPQVAQILVEKFGISGITDVVMDLGKMKI